MKTKFLLVTTVLLSALILPNKICAQFTLLHNFSGSITDGSRPYGALYSDGTFLYGTTESGGATNDGMIFKIKPDGTSFIDLFDFTSGVTGSAPDCALISDGTFLYGTCTAGGVNNAGTIFKIKPDGTGFLKIFDFLYASSGSDPECTLFFDGTFLYGTTTLGGAQSDGTAFKIKPDGTGYLKIFDFAGTSFGSHPSYGALVSDGTFLYGTTRYGGNDAIGCVYKIKPDGTGFLKLIDFNGAGNGKEPRSGLIYDGTFLYGMTNFGRTSNFGDIFKIKTDGTNYAELHQFAGGADGASSFGSLFYNGTFLYGMTAGGGDSSSGTIFKIKPDGTGYSTFFSFSTSDGILPYGSLISDGNFLYGTTVTQGAGGQGTIFKYAVPSTGIVESNAVAYFNLFPNPVSNTLHIQFNNLHDAQIKITNILGEKMLNAQMNNVENTMNISELSNGIYFVEVSSFEGTITEKIIVQH